MHTHVTTALVILCVSTTDALADSPVFTDITSTTGITFEHTTGFDGSYWFPEIVGPGCALLDADGDGALDIYFVNGGRLSPGDDGGRPPNALYRNLGDGRFADVTAPAGVAGAHYGQGCTVGDYDGDGDHDLYVTNVGPNHLFRNDGQGVFTDVAGELGVDDAGWGTSAAFGDVDGDGDLDLFVTNYCIWSLAAQVPCRTGTGEPDYCKPSAYQPAPDVFYCNRGDGTFEVATQRAGLTAAFGHGLGVLIADFDEDGDQDIYVANDGDPNSLWLNQGNGTFVDDGALAGVALNAMGNAEASMGVTLADLEEDGDWDLFMTHMTRETNTLYLNGGGGFFEDATQSLGLGAPSMPYTGFGTLFFDAELDGDLDLFIANGAVIKGDGQDRGDWPYAQRDQFFVGESGRFRELEDAAWLAPEAVGRGAAFGDLDADGDVDIVVANAGGPPRVLRNDSVRGGRWLGVRAERDGMNRHGLGAVVTVEAAGVTQRRRIGTDGSFASANAARALFGLPAAARQASVTVRWPDGAEQTWEMDALDVDVVVRHGRDGVGVAESRLRVGTPVDTKDGPKVHVPRLQIPPLPALEQVDEDIAQRVRDARTGVEARPDDAGAWKIYGIALYADVSSYESARTALLRAIELAPEDERTAYLLGMTGVQLGDLELARTYFAHVLARVPDYTPARLRLAELAVQNRDLDEAKAAYRMILAGDPDDSFALEGLGRAQRLAGEPKAAVDNLRAAVDLSPRSRAARYELGLALRAIGDLDGARDHLAAAAELQELRMHDPWLAELGKGRGGDQQLLTSANMARLAGDLERAHALYLEYSRRKPEDAVGWANLAAVSRDRGLLEEALAAADKTLALDATRAETAALRGAVLVQRGDLEGALASFDRAVAQNAGLAQAWFDRGLVLSKLRQSTEAVESFQRYVALRPDDARGFLELAEAQLAIRAHEDAAVSLEQTLRLDPTNAVAHFRSGGIELAASAPEKAEAHFQAALTARPSWADAYYGLALARHRTGQVDEALAAVQAAIELQPQNPRYQQLALRLQREKERQ